MKYNVRLVNPQLQINKTIQVDEDDFILEVAEQNGLDLPVSCRTGTCLTCTGKLIQGKVERCSTYLKPDEEKAGFVLTCYCKPQSDCIILTHQEEALLDL